MTQGNRIARSLARLNTAMGAVALIALASLLVEHGLRITPWDVEVLHVVNLLCVILFATMQAAKLLVVERPGHYFSAHWIDFSLLFVVAVQTAVFLGLRDTPEHRYLQQQGHPSVLWAFYIATVQVYFLVIVVLRSHLVHRLLVQMRLRPAQILVVSFLILIAGGALLLALPGASRDGRSIGAIDAFFTATSAVCVTGLVVRDTGTQFGPMGQSFLLLLIQAGGLGILTITAFFALFTGPGMAREEGERLAQAMDVEEAGTMARALQRMIVATLAVEAAGAALLYVIWKPIIPDVMGRAFWSVFHAVSAFCNAGFALFPRDASLTDFAGDPVTLGVIASLIVAGGLGFVVLSELGGRLAAALRRRPPAPLSRHARWALVMTALLLVAGAVAFRLLEADRTLAASRGVGGWLAAAFQSVTLRTAGFNTFALGGLGMPGAVLCIIWMLIGGSPGGTAGGIKTTTLAVVVAVVTGRQAFDREVRRRAVRVLLLFIGSYAVSTILLALVQGGMERRIAFEAASALGTVGLSMGATSELGTAGKMILCVTMFVGRVGPFAVAASILRTAERRPAALSRNRVLVG